MNILITSGPTREFIDPIRFISNRSTGKMGKNIASAACRRGHGVTIISGPVSEKYPAKAKLIEVQTSKEMHRNVMNLVDKYDVFIMCAAVADYTPVKREQNKIKKKTDILSIRLKKTRDILFDLGKKFRNNKSKIVVGFSAETINVISNSLKKLRDKNCDILVANKISAKKGPGFESVEINPTILYSESRIEKYEVMTKKMFANELVKVIEEYKK